MLEQVAQLDPVITTPDELTQVVVVLFTGLASAYRYYRKTGKLPLGKIPFTAIRKLLYTARVVFFTFDGPPSTKDVDANLSTFETALGVQSYTIDWPFSFHYKGEDMNAARYYYDPEAKYPHRQVHIRAWNEKDGVKAYAHDEPSALHHISAHIRGVDKHNVTKWVVQNWDSEGGLNPKGLPTPDESD